MFVYLSVRPSACFSNCVPLRLSLPPVGQDFREKNTDHLRPDIVALLKSSKKAFICGLMGIDPVATFRWAVLRAYFRALVAFREAGSRHTHSKTGNARIQGTHMNTRSRHTHSNTGHAGMQAHTRTRTHMQQIHAQQGPVTHAYAHTRTCKAGNARRHTHAYTHAADARTARCGTFTHTLIHIHIYMLIHIKTEDA